MRPCVQPRAGTRGGWVAGGAYLQGLFSLAPHLSQSAAFALNDS